jgi:acyl dehydratase
MAETIEVSRLPELVGQELEPSDWLEITQERVNQFADATNDHQFIHVDNVKASQTPFGGTIAHGYLTLSLMSYFSMQSGVLPEGLVMAVNYGSDKVRYLAPVPVGARVRALMKIAAVSEKKPGQWLIKTDVTIEIEGQETPALVAEILGLYIVA